MLELDQSQLTEWLQRPEDLQDLQELEKVKASVKLVIMRLCFAL